ncbi:hypothetical protein ABPG75_001651 [Micractinium tetrahymenae]
MTRLRLLPAVLLLALAQLLESDARQLQEGAVSSQIVGGFAAQRGRYPWMASLRYNDGSGLDLRCGGSLIHPRIVMTAAHCVVDMETGKLLPSATSLPLVRIGGYRRTLDAPSEYELRRAVRTVWHPGFVTGYRPDQMSNDLALLLLDRPSSRQPVKLAQYTPKPALPLPEYTQVSALGWGWTSPDVDSPFASYAQELQEVRLKLLPLSVCAAKYGCITYTDSQGRARDVPLNWQTNAMLCVSDLAYPNPRAGTCSGDSGGPVFVKGRNASEDVVIGVDSFGPRPCGSYVDGITDVGALRNWIDATVSALTVTRWFGQVAGGQQILGFNGGRSVGSLRAGSQMTLLRTQGRTATTITAKLAPGLAGMNAVMAAVNITAPGLSVSIQRLGPRLAVAVNGFPLFAGRSRSVGGSTIQNKAGTPNQVTLQQPGMQVQVTQPWIGRLAPWLDVSVQLTQAPVAPTGVLGATFPQLASLAKSSR